MSVRNALASVCAVIVLGACSGDDASGNDDVPAGPDDTVVECRADPLDESNVDELKECLGIDP